MGYDINLDLGIRLVKRFNILEDACKNAYQSKEAVSIKNANIIKANCIPLLILNNHNILEKLDAYHIKNL